MKKAETFEKLASNHRLLEKLEKSLALSDDNIADCTWADLVGGPIPIHGTDDKVSHAGLGKAKRRYMKSLKAIIVEANEKLSKQGVK